MGQARNWRPEEDAYLKEKWGELSIPGIARHLGRSVEGVKLRANRLGLGNMLLRGDYITFNQLLIAFCGTNGGGNYKLKSWVQDRGLPVHLKRIVKKRVRVVYLEEFWEWAEKNRAFLDFSKMEPLALGAEPDWVAEQRRRDYRAFAMQRKDPWTPEEDSGLIMLLRQHKYGYAQLSNMLHRSNGAIQRRCTDLGLKERPVPAERTGNSAAWSEVQLQRMAEGIRAGESMELIACAVGKSEKAVRGKCYQTYFTENADRIRDMMADGPWGAGAPVPTVRQARYLNGYKITSGQLLARLVGVLYHRTLDLKKNDYDQYFQRAVCSHWDVLHGRCLAGGEDCDACPSFERIPPQYCVRCGATFYERRQSEDRICLHCRAARKKQAQRKWRRLNRKEEMR